LDLYNHDVKYSGNTSRRSFIKLLAVAAVGMFFALWHALSGRNRTLTSKPLVYRVDPEKLGNGIHFYDNFILFLAKKRVKVYSNTCTHAGCRINREIAGELVCPCHGSKFEASTGRVLLGPAGMPLKSMSYTIDPKTGELIIKT